MDLFSYYSLSKEVSHFCLLFNMLSNTPVRAHKLREESCKTSTGTCGWAKGTIFEGLVGSRFEPSQPQDYIRAKKKEKKVHGPSLTSSNAGKVHVFVMSLPKSSIFFTK